MAEIKRSVTIRASSATVWAEVRDFNSLPTWHPQVESSEPQGDGQVRRLTVVGGRVELHRLVEFDDRTRSYTYVEADEQERAIVSDYRSTLRVLDSGAESIVEWTASFRTESPRNEAIAESFITSMYDEGLRSLKERLDGAPER